MRIWRVLGIDRMYMRSHIMRVRVCLVRIGSIMLTVMTVGCVTCSNSPETMQANGGRKVHVDFIARFKICGEVRDAVSNSPISNADVVFVDTGLGSLYGIQRFVTDTDSDGKFDENLSYWWGLNVNVPTEYFLDRACVESKLRAGIVSNPTVDDVLRAKRNEFEIWIIKKGYQTERVTISLSEDLRGDDRAYIADCKVINLEAEAADDRVCEDDILWSQEVLEWLEGVGTSNKGVN